MAAWKINPVIFVLEGESRGMVRTLIRGNGWFLKEGKEPVPNLPGRFLKLTKEPGPQIQTAFSTRRFQRTGSAL